MEDRPRRIKAEWLPYDECNIEQLLDALYESGFILRYQVDGERYIQIPKFTDHQNPHPKEKASVIPEPLASNLITRQVPENPEQEMPLSFPSGSSGSSGPSHSEPDAKTVASPDSIAPTVISIQKSPAAALLEKQTQWFAVFWEAYWRKDGGKKAAWLKFCAKVRTEQQFHCVMNAVMAQTPVMLSREIEHRPHATTWLNQERWEDEHSPGKVGGDRESSSERLLRKVAENIRETGRPF